VPAVAALASAEAKRLLEMLPGRIRARKETIC
jgi:hypothetical protein